MTKEKRVRKKINIKALFVMLLILYLIGMLIYYFFTMPIKKIIINGNTLLSDTQIIEKSSLENKLSFFRTSSKSIRKTMENLDTVKKATIKKALNGTLTIDIVEEQVLFYNKPTEKYVLSNNKQTEIENLNRAVPTLINYTPSEILEKLVKKMTLIDQDIISLVSEIEYSKDEKNGVVIDEYRFILRMNDGNLVYINLANFEKLQRYKELYMEIGSEKKGTFWLDGSQPVSIFKEFGAEVNENEEITDELPQ